MRELDIIAAIREHLAAYDQSVACGIGDDCAVYHSSTAPQLITCDTLLEGHHFDLSWHPPYQLGIKAMAANISDIAAMGGRPRHATISLTFTPQMELAWLEQFIKGLAFMHRRYNINLLGGDTVLGEKLSITVTLLGEAVTKPIYRSGAKPGETIYVGAHLGSAGAGLYLCQQGLQQESRYQKLVEHHLAPMPQVELGTAMARLGTASAMQDISDGVATDLAHICKASGVRANIAGEKVPVLPELCHFCQEYGFDPLQLALQSGDDYLLLFTMDERHEAQLRSLTTDPIHPIGKIEQGSGVFLIHPGGREEEISHRGYEHGRG